MKLRQPAAAPCSVGNCIAPRILENVSTTALSLNSLFFEPIFRAKLNSKKISIEELHRFCHHGPLFPNPCNRNIVWAPSVDWVVAMSDLALHSTVPFATACCCDKNSILWFIFLLAGWLMSILSLWFYILAFVHISTFIAISADDFFCLLLTTADWLLHKAFSSTHVMMLVKWSLSQSGARKKDVN